MRIADSICGYFFGQGCLGCNVGPLPADAWLCEECQEQLRLHGETPLWPSGSDVVCLYPMNPLTRRLVLAMKYGGAKGLAAYLVGQSSVARNGEGQQILSSLAKGANFVPVPVHPARLRERGYNQSVGIAHALAKACSGKVCCDILWRKKYRDSQTYLGKKERSDNVAGAFAAKPEKVSSGVPWVLVDDVYTTGATTGACAYAMRKVGLGPVRVCTLLYEKPVHAKNDWLADQSLDYFI